MGRIESYQFELGDNIGAPDAVFDEVFLKSCFIDLPGAEKLYDTSNPFSIILARTGCGKTALLERAKASFDNVVQVSPEAISFNYISNSSSIKFFEKIGVSVEPFYKLLWQHVIIIELIRQRFNIKERGDLESLRYRILNYFRSDAEKEALEYFQEWAGDFWESAEYKPEEVVTKIDQQLKAGLGADFASLSAELSAADAHQKEWSGRIIQKAHEAVMNNAQLAKLTRLLAVLNREVFNDPSQKFIVLIDDLDEGWVTDNNLRFKLIRALIETVKTMRTLQNVKVLVALRTDLRDTVFRETTSTGFQLEKYKSLFFELRWSRQDLEKLVERRIDAEFSAKYTKDAITSKDLFSVEKVDGGKKPVEYILERTLNRPREAIVFLNACIAKALGKSKIDRAIIRAAEREYSRERFQSLYEEWGLEHPLILEQASILRDLEVPFCLNDLTNDYLRNHLEDLATSQDTDKLESDPIMRRFLHNYNSQTSNSKEASIIDACRRELVCMFYKVGLVGIKPYRSPREWSFIDSPTIQMHEIDTGSSIDIHIAFDLALRLQRKGSRKES